MKEILNLTQHIGTPDQNVCEPANKPQVQQYLTFNQLPTPDMIDLQVAQLVQIAHEWAEQMCDGYGMSYQEYTGSFDVMVGGAPYLLTRLVPALQRAGFRPVVSFTQRVSEETHSPDGGVIKTNVFKHVGWVVL